MTAAAATDFHGNEHFDPAALKAVIDWWNRSACGCCSPDGLQEGLDHLLWYDAEHLAEVRHFAIELAAAAQFRLEDLAKDAAEVKP